MFYTSIELNWLYNIANPNSIEAENVKEDLVNGYQQILQYKEEFNISIQPLDLTFIYVTLDLYHQKNEYHPRLKNLLSHLENNKEFNTLLECYLAAAHSYSRSKRSEERRVGKECRL